MWQNTAKCIVFYTRINTLHHAVDDLAIRETCKHAVCSLLSCSCLKQRNFLTLNPVAGIVQSGNAEKARFWGTRPCRGKSLHHKPQCANWQCIQTQETQKRFSWENERMRRKQRDKPSKRKEERRGFARVASIVIDREYDQCNIWDIGSPSRETPAYAIPATEACMSHAIFILTVQLANVIG